MMRRTLAILALFSALLSLAFAQACADGDVEADKLGIGASCATADDCADNQQCLTVFKGGYCGLSDCAADADCPQGSACVAHDDGRSYCFRVCSTKADCNAHRAADQEANCSSN